MLGSEFSPASREEGKQLKPLSHPHRCGVGKSDGGKLALGVDKEGRERPGTQHKCEFVLGRLVALSKRACKCSCWATATTGPHAREAY